MRRKVINPLQRYGSVNPLAPEQAGSVQYSDQESFDAVVEDVVVNETHPEFSSDGYNVGCVKFRTQTDSYRSDGVLNWAYPISSDIEDFPLRGEVVWIIWMFTRFYYVRTINVGNNAAHQALFGLLGKQNVEPTSKEKMDDFNQTKYAPHNVSDLPKVLGNYFSEKDDVYRLKHWEGDRIWQGRSGQSIRLGASWLDERFHEGVMQATEGNQSPSILIRVGQSPTAIPNTENVFGRIVEDINNDKTSIWMVSDQIVPLKPSTTSDNLIHIRSVSDYPSVFSGNQLIFNSDRIILNSKFDKILVHAGNGYHVTTLKDSTLDVQRDYVSIVGRDKAFEILRDYEENVGSNKTVWAGSDITTYSRTNTKFYTDHTFDIHAGSKISLISSRVFIGSAVDQSEHLVLGDTLVSILNDLIDALTVPAIHVQTMAGPGFLDGGVRVKLEEVRSKLHEVLSKSNFVAKENETPTKVKDRKPIHPR